MSKQNPKRADPDDFENSTIMSKEKQEKVEYGNPTYGAEDDIYNNQERVEGSITDHEMENNNLDNNLDIPGADLDDANEEIGEEDEENNYYSLGGDDHNDLEEDNN